MPKILIVIDPEETQHSALNRIKEVSPDNMQIKVDYYMQPQAVSAAEASQCHFTRDKKIRWLNAQVEPYRDMGYQIETEVLDFTRLYETIIQSATKFQADIIFKPIRQHTVLQRTFFTSTDWNLIRLCAVPLLLVSNPGPVQGSPVLAAVNSTSTDSAHQELNNIVIDQAKMLANIVSSEVHMVSAQNFGAVVPSGMGIADPLAQEITRNKRAAQYDKALRYAQSQDIIEKNVHVVEGVAEVVVNNCADRIAAAVIVLGTVARSGISGLFIGNTAEAVMEHTCCDVFVVKQPGFQSPIAA